MLPATRVFVGIIGTAGRGKLEAKMTKEIYEKMVSKALNIIESDFKLDCNNVVLVSGGAAWSDHVAIDLFNSNKIASLQLFLPCKFDTQTSQFYDKKSKDWRVNPGPSANKYHNQFSKKLGRDTLAEIGSLKGKPNVTIQDFNGFHARNKIIAAKSNYLIAFSWSNGTAPADGGTQFTWNLFKGKKSVHIPLATLEQQKDGKSLKRKASASDLDQQIPTKRRKYSASPSVATQELQPTAEKLIESQTLIL